MLSRQSEGPVPVAWSESGSVWLTLVALVSAGLTPAMLAACAGSTASRPHAVNPKKNCFITARLTGLSCPPPDIGGKACGEHAMIFAAQY